MKTPKTIKKVPLLKHDLKPNPDLPGQTHSHPHPLNQFFGCCLGDEPAPLNPRIQKLRQEKMQSPTKIIHTEMPQTGQDFQVEPDMVVGDLIMAFPKIKNYLEELHPLGLLSPMINHTTLEIFLSDFNLDLKNLCQTLSKLTK